MTKFRIQDGHKVSNGEVVQVVGNDQGVYRTISSPEN